MQFSRVLIAASTVAMALASPVELTARTGTACSGKQGIESCCASTSRFGDLNALQQLASGLVGLNILADVVVGLSCTVIGGVCQTQQVCCNNNQAGLINIGLGCVVV